MKLDDFQEFMARVSDHYGREYLREQAEAIWDLCRDLDGEAWERVKRKVLTASGNFLPKVALWREIASSERSGLRRIAPDDAGCICSGEGLRTAWAVTLKSYGPDKGLYAYTIRCNCPAALLRNATWPASIHELAEVLKRKGIDVVAFSTREAAISWVEAHPKDQGARVELRGGPELSQGVPF